MKAALGERIVFAGYLDGERKPHAAWGIHKRQETFTCKKKTTSQENEKLKRELATTNGSIYYSYIIARGKETSRR